MKIFLKQSFPYEVLFVPFPLFSDSRENVTLFCYLGQILQNCHLYLVGRGLKAREGRPLQNRRRSPSGRPPPVSSRAEITMINICYYTILLTTNIFKVNLKCLAPGCSQEKKLVPYDHPGSALQQCYNGSGRALYPFVSYD